jgi:hypothetical protein
VSQDDWYRGPEWSAEDQEAFERRLKRARDWNRGEYLRIKGLALYHAGEVSGARTLWGRIIDEPAYRFDHPFALELSGDSWRDEDPELAEQFYRRLLSEFPDLNSTTGTVEVSLAELLVARTDDRSLIEAQALLDAYLQRLEDEEGPYWPNVMFRLEMARLRIAESRRDSEATQVAAKAALKWAHEGSPFDRHPDIGIVHPDEQTLERLQRLAH